MFKITKNAASGRMIMYDVFNNGELVGVVEKIKNDGTNKYPWEIYDMREPTPRDNVAVAVFYDDKDSVDIPNFDYTVNKLGGKTAAMLFVRKYFNNK